MFHPLPPAPCFLYGWSALQSTEAMYHALGQVQPELAPALREGYVTEEHARRWYPHVG